MDDQLLRSLLETGRVRPRRTQLANGRLYTSSGLDVVGPAHRTVDAAGRVHPGRHVLGLQLSAVQWGLAIAAQPGTAPRSLRDADALAQTLLESAQAPGDLATLQRYRERQQLDQQLTVGFSDKVTRLFGSTRSVVTTGRNLGLLGLDLLPPAKRWFARQAMGLGTRSDV